MENLPIRCSIPSVIGCFDDFRHNGSAAVGDGAPQCQFAPEPLPESATGEAGQGVLEFKLNDLVDFMQNGNLIPLLHKKGGSIW